MSTLPPWASLAGQQGQELAGPGTSPHVPPTRYVVLFNSLDQERLSLVSLLVSAPHVRVFSEDGQPLAVQVSAHWKSATTTAPDVYQVRCCVSLPMLLGHAAAAQH